jgi:hypothetical protein
MTTIKIFLILKLFFTWQKMFSNAVRYFLSSKDGLQLQIETDVNHHEKERFRPVLPNRVPGYFDAASYCIVYNNRYFIFIGP